MKLPSELTREQDFMTLFHLAMRPLDADRREQLETVIAIAFMAGEAAGVAQSLQIVRTQEKRA